MSSVRNFNEYYSHPNKLLTVHTDGVAQRVVDRTDMKFAHIASKVHDVGKINPNFQMKLKPNTLCLGYSSHAYLSAITFLSIPKNVRQTELGLLSSQSLSVAMITALHHGNLRNCMRKPVDDDTVEIGLAAALGEQEYTRALKFVRDNPSLPFLEYALERLGMRSDFNQGHFEHSNIPIFNLVAKKALNFFIDTQFAFATLLESDKRDAGDNSEERRSAGINLLSEKLDAGLAKPITTDMVLDLKSRQLNTVRTKIRVEALARLENELNNNKQRISCLNGAYGSRKDTNVACPSKSHIAI